MDPLTILITGDVSGIQTAVKQALNIVTGGVEAMNDQTVDWTAIFSRAVSPAIISGVASVFAFAISQALEFQQAMNETGTAAGLTTTQIGTMGAASQSLADATGQSATDIGSAFGAVAPVFADTATQQTFVAEATQLAASGFGNLSDIVQAALPIMQLFGVTTSQQVTEVFTELMHGAEGSGESLSAFAQQFLTVAPNLKAGGANISDLNNLLSGFSAEIANLGLTQAQAAFSTFGQAVSGANPALNAMLGSSQSLLNTVKNEGLAQALADMGTKIDASGKSAALLYTNLGLSIEAIDGLKASASQLPAIATDEQKIATNAQTINDALNQSNSSMRVLEETWATLKTIAVDAGNGIMAVIEGIYNEGEKFQGLLQTLTGSGPAAFFSEIGTTIAGATQAANNFVTAGTEASQVYLGTTGQVDKLLSGSGLNFTPSQLNTINNTGTSDQLMQLLSALGPGKSTALSPNNLSFFSTFNLTVPPGATGLTAKQIAQQLYNQFQGTQ